MTENRAMTMRASDTAWKSMIAGIVLITAIALSGADRLVAQEGKPQAKPEAAARIKLDSRDAAPAPASEGPASGASGVPTGFLDMMLKGGPVMWVLLGCSVLLLAFVFDRLVALRQSRVIPRAFVSRFLQQVRDGDVDRDRALALCQDNPSPIAMVFAGAVRKWGRPSVEIEQAIIDTAERATYDLRRYLRVFTALAVIGPLLGLLGTVIGMMFAFNAVSGQAAQGRPNAELLATGISWALLNTAGGLVLAIPAQSFYLYFASRADRLVIEMDRLGQELVQMISAEDLQGRPDAKVRRPLRKESTT